MSRLFTFGCSYTKYPWGTWADILGEEYDEFINLGQGGGGNEQIFFKIIQTNQKYNFTKDDTVAVCWTFHHRRDVYQINKWMPRPTSLPKERAKEHKQILDWFGNWVINPDEQWLKTLGYINVMNTFIPGICNYICFSTIDYGLGSSENAGKPWHNHETNKLFYHEINQFATKNYDSTFNISQDRDCKNRVSVDIRPVNPNGIVDAHPTPKEHLYFLEHIMNITISESTKQKVDQWEQKIHHIINTSDG